MDKLVIKLIRLSISKGFDIEFSECPDFNDARTMNIFLTKGFDNNILYESDRITMKGNPYDMVEVNKAISWLNTQER